MLNEEGENLLRIWFKRRFGKTPEQDRSYFSEWRERFEKGSPYIYMDFESRRSYLKVLQERIDAFGGMGSKRKGLMKVS